MNPGDHEILELNELCGALVDRRLTESQRARLAQLLHDSEAARRFYVRAMNQSASLHSYASEMHAEGPEHAASPRRAVHFGWWMLGSLAAAASLAIAVWWPGAKGRNTEPGGVRAGQFVARVTAAKDPQWTKRSNGLLTGTQLRRGQQLELTSGFAEITFDSGARVVIEGTATLEINSAWDTTLHRGTLKAIVPPEAIGFRVSNPVVEVVDLGTEFTMIADGKGSADVLVLKGEVEAAPRMTGEQETILLREKDSRRFAESGITAVANRDEKFARFAQAVALDPFVAPNSFVHWSFDDAAGNRVQANSAGVTITAEDASMQLFDVNDASAVHPASPHGRALQLDGELYARGRFPGISGPEAHTVSFWVKVPDDAQLFEAYTIVAWVTNLPKLSYRPVQISWNRRREEGPFGALRTDFGGGSAIGTTTLRDGRWHHVAVYFAAGADANTPVQVKQYVDGRLESSTINPGPTRAVGSPQPTLIDVVWIGRRLTGAQKYPERFRGEIDELFITPRGLQPNEIVTLMKENRLPTSDVAVTNRTRP
jgi:ferric-dicitrate binding protein FerR (iron transport regulator)